MPDLKPRASISDTAAVFRKHQGLVMRNYRNWKMMQPIVKSGLKNTEKYWTMSYQPFIWFSNCCRRFWMQTHGDCLTLSDTWKTVGTFLLSVTKAGQMSEISGTDVGVSDRMGANYLWIVKYTKNVRHFYNLSDTALNNLNPHFSFGDRYHQRAKNSWIR